MVEIQLSAIMKKQSQHAEQIEAALNLPKKEPQVIVNGVHQDDAGAYITKGLPIGEGRGYHNHTYETIHYEFMLGGKIDIFEKYPAKGPIPFMDRDRTVFYELCCSVGLGGFKCGDNNIFESYILRDYETQEHYIKVKYMDKGMAGKYCTLTFILDESID